MLKAPPVIVLICFLSASVCYAQFDTIIVDATLSIITEADITATGVHNGDTSRVFKVAEDIIINNTGHQNFVAIKKGAQVLAVVESSVVPGKLKPNIGGKVYDDPDWRYRPAYTDLKTGGELVIKLISVEAEDGTYLPLNDCIMQKFGGLFGGYKSYKIQASILAGSHKSCETRNPGAMILIKK